MIGRVPSSTSVQVVIPSGSPSPNPRAKRKVVRRKWSEGKDALGALRPAGERYIRSDYGKEQRESVGSSL